MQTEQQPGFTGALKDWRKIRKMSQLDLSLEARVSQRHLSWLETGRAKPSREMVVRLSDSLQIPNRDRNRLLNLAGYAPIYQESELGEPLMVMVADVLEKMLANHNPYPAMVMDRYWNLKMKNQAADQLFALLGDPDELQQKIGGGDEFNIARLSLHPQGLRQFITNWDEVVLPFFTRLKREAASQHDPQVMHYIDSLSEFVAEDIKEQSYTIPLSPILPLRYSLNGLNLSLVSVISSFGGAQDVTANELRIESFYPADESTAQYFRQADNSPN
jgi:transcriptional regulator with XRE-family HTH domain